MATTSRSVADMREMGMMALKTIARPSIAIIKTIPEGIVELSLRAVAVILAFLSLIAAAVCQGTVANSALRGTGVVPDTETFDAAAWVIFLSFWVIVYQILAVVQLFLRIELLYITIPLLDWSLFFLVDVIAIGIGAAGYFCGAIPLAVYAARWEDINGQTNLGTAPVVASSAVTSFFCFVDLFLLIGIIVYFFVAQVALKWATHGELIEDPLTEPPSLDVYRPAPE